MGRTKIDKRLMIGRFEFDLHCRTLRNGQQVVRLRKKECCILEMFVNRPGEIISKQEITNRLWQGNDKLGNKGMRQVIWRLRTYFGDTVEQQRYIETITNMGYRFVFPLAVEEEKARVSKISAFNKKIKRYFCDISKAVMNKTPNSTTD